MNRDLEAIAFELDRVADSVANLPSRFTEPANRPAVVGGALGESVSHLVVTGHHECHAIAARLRAAATACRVESQPTTVW